MHEMNRFNGLPLKIVETVGGCELSLPKPQLKQWADSSIISSKIPLKIRIFAVQSEREITTW